MINFAPDLTHKQTLAWDAFYEHGKREVLYGGARFGGKSHFGCDFVAAETLRIIKVYGLKPQRHPMRIGWMGRKIAKAFRETTLETWQRIIPPDLYELRGNPAEIIIAGTVSMGTGGLDRREDVSQFLSADLCIVFIDQAEETTRDDVSDLRAAAKNRLILNGEVVPGKILFTANPAPCWLRSEFITKPTAERAFIQALPADNPHITPEYIQTLKDAYAHRPELLEAYLHGNWDVLEGAMQLIKQSAVRSANLRTTYPPYVKKLVSVDCARFGDDECVIYALENTDIAAEVILPQSKATEIAAEAAKLRVQTESTTIVVEGVGADLGSAVADILAGMGQPVMIFNPAGASSNPDIYYSLRDEMWDYVARAFATGQLGNERLLMELHTDDERLINQLCAPQYDFKRGRFLVESKDKTKERLHESPDRGDSYCIGVFHLQYIEPVKEHRVGYHEKYDDIPASPMVL
jgi:hypothetical protein